MNFLILFHLVFNLYTAIVYLVNTFLKQRVVRNLFFVSQFVASRRCFSIFSQREGAVIAKQVS